MFNFFKKKPATKYLGGFSIYGMEDVYDFIGERRIQRKLSESGESIPFFFTFSDIFRMESPWIPSGELNFLSTIMMYFSDQLDIALYLLEKSKTFSEKNYPKKENLKESVAIELKSFALSA